VEIGAFYATFILTELGGGLRLLDRVGNVICLEDMAIFLLLYRVLTRYIVSKGVPFNILSAFLALSKVFTFSAVVLII
jgi:hypothetical protein